MSPIQHHKYICIVNWTWKNFTLKIKYDTSSENIDFRIEIMKNKKSRWVSKEVGHLPEMYNLYSISRPGRLDQFLYESTICYWTAPIFIRNYGIWNYVKLIFRGKIGMNDQTQHTMIHCYWRHADILIDVTLIHSRDYASTYFLQKQNLYSPSFIFTSGKGWT